MKYTPKFAEVLALQVEIATLGKVELFLKGLISHMVSTNGFQGVIVERPEGKMDVPFGHWLVRHGDAVAVFSPSAFTAMFRGEECG